MKIFKKVASLVAAGMAVGSATVSAEQQDGINAEHAQGSNLSDWVKDLVAENKSKQAYTLAYHSSHQSHASHYSHSSHRSYSYNSMPQPDEQLTATDLGERLNLEGRNVTSTPNNTILPSSVAITKKVKILPGNSLKFKEVVTNAQLALTGRGYDVGALDGQLHARTVAAIHSFQKSVGMIPTGKLDSDTLSRLGVVAS